MEGAGFHGRRISPSLYLSSCFEEVSMYRLIAVMILAGVLVAPGLAHAQSTEPSPDISRLELGLAALEEDDFDGALQNFQAAFEAGEPDAGFYLGRMAELGIGVEADIEAARVLYAAAADAGSARAMNRIGLMHFRGEGVLQDFLAAQELICAAADQGDRDAGFNCAGFLLEGIGVAEDADPEEIRDTAFAMYRAAAEQGHIGAMNALAFAHRDGLAPDADTQEAITLFRRAADLGNPIALFELGLMLEEGFGVERDLVEAHMHLNLAAARRHPVAPQALARVTEQLSPSEILQAQQRARSWQPAASD
jgi:TPR repeat protein